MNRRRFLSAFTAAAVGLATGMGLRRDEPLQALSDAYDAVEIDTSSLYPNADERFETFKRIRDAKIRKMWNDYEAILWAAP